MGYAIFTARKLMLTNRINQISFRIMQLTQQQQTLSDQAGQMERALASRRNLFSNIGNIFQMGMEQTRQAQLNELYSSAQGGIENIDASKLGPLLGGSMNFMQTSLGMTLSIIQQSDQMVAEGNMRQVKEMENQIELQRKSLETQLNAAQKELEKVEQAEDKNIERSAPKFA